VYMMRLADELIEEANHMLHYFSAQRNAQVWTVGLKLSIGSTALPFTFLFYSALVSNSLN
jgi:hypothetical protein